MDVKNKTKKDEDIINLFKIIDFDTKDLMALIYNLILFSYEFKSLNDIELFLTFENFEILKKLSSKDNIKINLLLRNIYIDIINNESLYSNYLLSFDSDKIKLLIEIIDECISLIKKLKGFILDLKLFKFKGGVISLIKCIYINGKNRIKNETYIKKLQDLLKILPEKFFSEAFNNLNEDKNVFEIIKSQEEEKINIFEEKFAELNNYYEQFDVFHKFVECNLNDIKYDSIENIENLEKEKKEEKEKKDIYNLNKVDFYQKYGLFLLNFCYTYRFIFLNEDNIEETDEKEVDKEENEEEEDENDKNYRVIFLFDEINISDEIDEKKEKNDEEKNKKNNKKIENFMNKKLFISQTYSKEYKDLIKKEINYYLNITESIENEPKINKCVEKLKYYLNTIEEKSYFPLYINNPSKIIINDHFTDSFLLNVSEGKKKIFYIETKINETMMIFIEYSLEEKSKDINFEINKYEMETNSFKPIFKEEKIEDNCKFYILCKGYSIYQIIFDNYYSWFTSKEINYKVSLLKLVEKNENEDINEEENEIINCSYLIKNILERNQLGINYSKFKKEHIKSFIPEFNSGLGNINYMEKINNIESNTIKINNEDIRKLMEGYNIEKKEIINKCNNSQTKKSLENLSFYLKTNSENKELEIDENRINNKSK